MARRILAFFAHPDDETYGPGAALAAAARHHDTRVRLVIATRGEAGSLGISRNYPREDLARIRQWELIEAASTLGAELGILGYPDGGLEAVPESELTESMVEEILRFRPHVLVTFHPNGLSGHPDHRCVTRLLGRAARIAASPRAGTVGAGPWQVGRLWYFAISETRAALIAGQRRLHSVPDAEIDRTLDGTPWLRIKHRMARQHATQMAFYDFLEAASGSIDTYWSHETFVLDRNIFGPINDCNDLFYGLDNPA